MIQTVSLNTSFPKSIMDKFKQQDQSLRRLDKPKF